MSGVSKGESFWRNLIAHCERSKLTVDEACEQAGVSRASFYHWQKRLRDAERMTAACAEQTTTSSLVPVKLVEDRIAEIKIDLPGDIRVRIPSGYDEDTLQIVLQTVLASAREQA